MTGGRVVVLGKTGRNFAAGMSGGIAYVYSHVSSFWDYCNREMVELEKVADEDSAIIYTLLNNHYKYTKSPIARKILDNYKIEMNNFVKVMPIEYKRVTSTMK